MKWYTVLFYAFTICAATDSPVDLVRGADESLENYAKRLLQRHSYESNDEFEVRVAFLEVLKPHLPIWHNYDYVKYITVSSENTTRPEYEPKHLDDLIQKTDENSTEYYKRIFVRHSDEDDYQYMERVSILRGILREHGIWVNNDFLTYAKPYILECQADIEFRENLKQKSDEANDEYYKRILRRHQYESNDEYAVRMAFTEPLTPELPIWENYEFLKHVTMDNDEKRPDYVPKHMDDIVKNADEDGEQYYTRIFKRYRDESVVEYMTRISILRALLKWRTVWLDNEYMNYVIPHILQKTPGSETYDPPPGTELPRPPVPFDVHGDHEQVVLKVGNSGTTASNQESDTEEAFDDEEGTDPFYLKKQDETLIEFCQRIFAKRPFESDSSYRRLLKKMMQQWLEFEMWKEKCKPYVDLDAILKFNKFARLKGESKSAYCRRLFEQRFYETDEEFEERQKKEKSRFPGFDHWKQECASVLTDNQ